MRSLLIGLTLLITTAPDRAADRQALLAADSTLALEGASFTDSASYLHPGSPLVRGASYIGTFLTNAKIARGLQREPVFADVSADGSLGYTWGWTHFEATRGKYLACWRKAATGWRLAAFAGTAPVPDSAPAHLVGKRDSTPPVRGHANPRDLLKADSAFAAMSAANAESAFSRSRGFAWPRTGGVESRLPTRCAGAESGTGAVPANAASRQPVAALRQQARY